MLRRGGTLMSVSGPEIIQTILTLEMTKYNDKHINLIKFS